MTFGCDICFLLLVGIGYWDGDEIGNWDGELGLAIGTGDCDWGLVVTFSFDFWL